MEAAFEGRVFLPDPLSVEGGGEEVMDGDAMDPAAAGANDANRVKVEEEGETASKICKAKVRSCCCLACSSLHEPLMVMVKLS